MHEAMPTHRIAVFTSVVGTLIDARTFDAGTNPAVVARLQSEGVPVIPISVLPLDEIEPVAERFGFRDVMVVEAGGAIARRSGSEWIVEPCGVPAELLLDVVAAIEDRSGAHLRVEMLDAATRRCYSEPFIIESGDPERVRRAAAELGYSIRSGRRYLYLCRECDEGAAFARVREEVRCEVAVALGGSMIDLEFLSRADIPMIVPGPDGPDPELLERVPHARVAPAPAPDGWAAVVEELLRSRGLRIAKARARRDRQVV